MITRKKLRESPKYSGLFAKANQYGQHQVPNYHNIKVIQIRQNFGEFDYGVNPAINQGQLEMKAE